MLLFQPADKIPNNHIVLAFIKSAPSGKIRSVQHSEKHFERDRIKLLKRCHHPQEQHFAGKMCFHSVSTRVELNPELPPIPCWFHPTHSMLISTVPELWICRRGFPASPFFDLTAMEQWQLGGVPGCITLLNVAVVLPPAPWTGGKGLKLRPPPLYSFCLQQGGRRRRRR